MHSWILKPSSNINQMLKVRNIASVDTSQYPTHLCILHRYATSDDLIFPEAATLAFFSAFEEHCLNHLDNALFVAQDINTGLLSIHIYTQDHNQTINETIEYLKRQPQFHIEFKVTPDAQWQIFKTLGD